MGTAAAAVAALLSSLAAVGALYFTAEQSRATRDQIAQSEQTLITTRYSSAIEQLGNEAIEVRIGSVYALERLTSDSPRDQRTIVAVISAFVRGQVPLAATPECIAPRPRGPSSLASDVSAALGVLIRNNAVGPGLAVNLEGVCLRDFYLEGYLLPQGLDLRNFFIASADLENADLPGANLAGASLAATDLDLADLRGANLTGADLRDADLTGVRWAGADLSGARLDRARGVDLTGTLGVPATMP